jgi:excinuclease ABC subunit A
MFDTITIKNARLHNLKNVNLSLPKNQLVVFTGLSGSGKSTLAIDTLHKESLRQLFEALGMVDYAGKPEVDRIEGLPPSIAIDQQGNNRSPRSTVGTSTEVFTYLRVLFARLGHRPCPNCGADIPPAYDVSDDRTDEEDSGEMYLPSVRHAGTRVQHGTFLVQQTGRRLSHLHRPRFSAFAQR